MLDFIVKTICYLRKKLSRDLGSPSSHQLLQLQLFPKFSKILGPPFKVCLAWICFGRMNYIVFATNLDHKVDLRSIVFLSVRSRTVNAFDYET